MSGPITNHTFGTMQHAEYEANARKHQAPQSERGMNLKFNLASRVSALIQKIQERPTNRTGSTLKTKSV